MMAAAGGLAAVGLMPVVTTFAVFCLRAVEQARLSLAYARRNAKIVASHPGLDVGPDGGSAQALEDIAAFRAIPGMIVFSPADPIEMAQATRAMFEYDGPVYMRTGRSPATSPVRRGPQIRNRQGRDPAQRQATSRSSPAASKSPARSKPPTFWARRRSAPASSTWPPSSRSIPSCWRAARAKPAPSSPPRITTFLAGSAARWPKRLPPPIPAPIEFVGMKDEFGASGEPDELAEHFGLTAPLHRRGRQTRHRTQGQAGK